MDGGGEVWNLVVGAAKLRNNVLAKACQSVPYRASRVARVQNGFEDRRSLRSEALLARSGERYRELGPKENRRRDCCSATHNPTREKHTAHIHTVHTDASKHACKPHTSGEEAKKLVDLTVRPVSRIAKREFLALASPTWPKVGKIKSERVEHVCERPAEAAEATLLLY